MATASGLDAVDAPHDAPVPRVIDWAREIGILVVAATIYFGGRVVIEGSATGATGRGRRGAFGAT